MNVNGFIGLGISTAAATLTGLFISSDVVAVSGIGTYIGVLHVIGGTSALGNDMDRFSAMSVSSIQMLDELPQDNSISAIIKQTLLHYHQDLVTLSSIFCYFIIKTWLQF